MKQVEISKDECRGKDAKSIFAKVIMDKREMQAYIKEHKTLKGFKGASFGFAKPL